MRIKFIGCDVFARPVYAYAAASPHTIDVVLLPMLKHNEPENLRRELQTHIDDTDAIYDRIVLGYGLCGNATVGLTAKTAMVVPRIHDCCTMFMGSRERFTEVFGENLSMRWCTSGYYERGMKSNDSYFNENYKTSAAYLKMQAEYGEDNADYIWQSLHPPIETEEAVYIKIDGFEYGDSETVYAEEIKKAGKALILTQGDLSWFNKLVNGPWDDGDFLYVPPGHKIEAVYDIKEVVRAIL
jgi:hypothetical protein